MGALLLVMLFVVGSCCRLFEGSSPRSSTYATAIFTPRPLYPVAAATMTARHRDLASARIPTWTPTLELQREANTTPTQTADILTEVAEAVVTDTATPEVLTPVTFLDDRWGVVRASVLNVRSGPGADQPVIGQVQFGDCLHIVGSKDDWLRVLFFDERQGWCFGPYVEAVSECPLPVVVQPTATSVPGLSLVQASLSVPSYVGRRLSPNANTVNDGWIHECFGSGDTPLRFVAANTPVEVLGKGEYVPPDNEREQMGVSPFLKIRLWDGQTAWVSASLIGVGTATLANVSNVCESYDRIDWSIVSPPTSTPVPQRFNQSPETQPARACCRVCTTGKACGDSCISKSYTCHKGPGCACNG